MAPPKRHIQQIRLKDRTKKVLAKERNGQIFVLLDDVKDVFEGARTLEYDGILVPFMTDENDVRLNPLRVEYYEDCILDVIVGPVIEDRGSSAPSVPIPIPSPQSTAPTSPDSSFSGSFNSPLTLSPSPVSVAPLSVLRPSLSATLFAVPEAPNETSTVPQVDENVYMDTPEQRTRTDSVASIFSASTTLEPDSGTLPAPPHPPPLLTKRPTSPSSSQTLHADQQDTPPRTEPHQSTSPDPTLSSPMTNTLQTVHTLPVQVPYDEEQYGQELSLGQYQHQHQEPIIYQPVSHGYSGQYTPTTAYNTRSLPPVPGQQAVASQQYHQMHHHIQQQQQYQHQYHQQYQQQSQQLYQYQTQVHTPQSTAETPPTIPPRPLSIASVTTATSSAPIRPFERLAIGNAPQALDPEGRALLASSPTATSFSVQPSFESVTLLQGLPPKPDHTLESARAMEENEAGLEYTSETRTIQLKSETKVKDLEMKLRRAQGQTLAYAKKNHALARESLQMSAQIRNRSTLIQNKVQEVLTQIHQLHESPIPRLFIVLPVLIMDSGTESALPQWQPNTLSSPTTASPIKTMPTNDQRKFRLHFLCECGQYTRPLKASGLNHIHFVEHEGYEIVKPVQFFERYGAFIRSLSHLIRKGVHCGTVSIPPLLSLPVQQQQQQQQQDADSIYRAYAVGQETLKKQILDTRLAEAIEYLDSLDSPDLHSLQDHVDYMDYVDGADIRQLQAYVNIPPQHIQCMANLYRIVTNRGHVKWICEDHYRSTIHQQNELVFQQEIVNLGGQYDLRTGRAKVRLGSAQDANQFYRVMSKANNMQELDIGLKWSFTESDLQKLVQAIGESRIGVLTLDGCRQKSDSSNKRTNFGKKYDPLLRVIYGSKIGTLKLTNMPSILHKISTKHPLPLAQSYGVKALHLVNVGVLDFSVSEKPGHTLNLSLGNGSAHNHSLAVMKNLLTSFLNLTELVVPGMNIRDEGVALLAEQQPLFKSLRCLNLSDNGISSMGGRLLASSLSRDKVVMHLDLGMNTIGDEALATIIGALGPKLSILNLESTGFGDKASKALERMVDAYSSASIVEPQLEYLNLSTNGWTTSGLQSLGRTIMKLRLEIPPPSSPSLTAPAPLPALASTTGSRKSEKANVLEMGPAEALLVVNSMIRTSQITLPADKPWHQKPRLLNAYAALTATKESYGLQAMKAQDSIADNSKLKVLRLSDAGLSEGAARYLIGLLDMAVLTKLDLRRCIRLFKPREMLTILLRIYPHSSYQQDGDTLQQHQRQHSPQAPAPLGVVGAPRNCLRFVHLNAIGVDDHVARVLAQDLQSGWSCIERLDIGGNHLTHQGVAMIMDALCQNQTLQHLNLGQNFSTPNSVYPSSASASAQSTREALKRFMMTNKTLQVLYFICADIGTVAEGLNANSSIRSLVFDRLQGSLRDMDDFGRALAVNQTLMRFKVYDNRQPPFLQAFYGLGVHPMHYQQQGQNIQQQMIQYIDPFKDFRQDAIRTLEKGLTFNNTLIELQWPEMFDRMQPWTDRLDAIMTRNMVKLKMSQGSSDASSQDGNLQRRAIRSSRNSNGDMLNRGVSVLSTSSTLSTGSDNSSTSSLSSLSSSLTHPKDPSVNRSYSGFVLPLASGPADGYSYSVHSNGSNTGSGGGGGGGGSNGTGSQGRNHTNTWDERKLSLLELSPWTLNQLRNAPTREQQQAQVQQQQQRAARAETETHIMQRFQRK